MGCEAVNRKSNRSMREFRIDSNKNGFIDFFSCSTYGECDLLLPDDRDNERPRDVILFHDSARLHTVNLVKDRRKLSSNLTS